jgi:small subunit ribosomal protein S9
MAEKVYATGRRKTSVARVFLIPGGKGNITVNKVDYKKYFAEFYHNKIEAPFALTETLGKFDVYSTVKGGGITGQAEAIRHGLARALATFDSEKYRKTLKLAGFLTRDDRMVERKKFGLRKARKREQYSKR